MREYVVEGLRPAEAAAVEAELGRRGLSSGIDGLHWIGLSPDDLEPLQREHLPSCGPYAAALETCGGTLRLEMLVRARGALHCACIAPATPAQEAVLAGALDALLDSLGVSLKGTLRAEPEGPEPRP